jgi:hypothetical protein
MKSEKGNGNEEMRNFTDKLEDLRGAAIVEAGFIGTLVELGQVAAGEYDGVKSKLASAGVSVFTDWQGFFCIMRKSVEKVEEALEAMDDLMVKSYVAGKPDR